MRKGDCEAIYLSMVCELPIAMLACARIGAVHNVVFAGFSAESLAQRIQDCKCAQRYCSHRCRKTYMNLDTASVSSM